MDCNTCLSLFFILIIKFISFICFCLKDFFASSFPLLIVFAVVNLFSHTYYSVRSSSLAHRSSYINHHIFLFVIIFHPSSYFYLSSNMSLSYLSSNLLHHPFSLKSLLASPSSHLFCNSYSYHPLFSIILILVYHIH